MIEQHGGLAYDGSRAKARAARKAGDGEAERRWGRIAVAIAEKEGRIGEIGVTGADRFEGP